MASEVKFGIAFWVCVLMVTHPSLGQDGVQVATGLGPVNGYRESVLGKPLDIFLGIPYAEPPIGEKRFRYPVPKGSWSAPLDATKLPNSCPQAVDTSFDRFAGVEMWNPNTEISEDCLYLNIWSPRGSQGGKMAVVVWLYGGSFAGGSSTLDIYNGRMMAAQGEVVVVSLQFRVGAIGLLHFGTPDAPGNAGMVDQQLGIKWIYDHIHNFGGDRARITLLGESSGAASAALHLLSEASKPYINNIILHSSSSLVSWGYDAPAVATKRATELATMLGCPTNTTNHTITCLRSKPESQISDLQWWISDPTIISSPFEPTIDNNFLTDSPQNLLNSSKRVNVLLGANQNEGSYFLIYRHYNLVNLTSDRYFNDNLYRQVVEAIANDFNSDCSSEIISAAQRLYETSGMSAPMDYLLALDLLMGDIAFTCPVVSFADMYERMGNDIYMYHFNHRTSANPWPEWAGVMHGYELDHVFGAPLNTSNIVYRAEERVLSADMVKYWTNFAKSGYDWVFCTLAT